MCIRDRGGTYSINTGTEDRQVLNKSFLFDMMRKQPGLELSKYRSTYTDPETGVVYENPYDTKGKGKVIDPASILETYGDPGVKTELKVLERKPSGVVYHKGAPVNVYNPGQAETKYTLKTTDSDSGSSNEVERLENFGHSVKQVEAKMSELVVNSIPESEKGNMTVIKMKALTILAMRMGIKNIKKEHVVALANNEPLNISNKDKDFIIGVFGHFRLLEGSFPSNSRNIDKLEKQARKDYEVAGKDFGKTLEIYNTGAFD